MSWTRARASWAQNTDTLSTVPTSRMRIGRYAAGMRVDRSVLGRVRLLGTRQTLAAMNNLTPAARGRRSAGAQAAERVIAPCRAGWNSDNFHA
jgi:hypothetical protein